MKLTPWYRGDQKPARVGVYERRYGWGAVRYCWWDGKNFSVSQKTSRIAQTHKDYFRHSICQSLPWRGVAK